MNRNTYQAMNDRAAELRAELVNQLGEGSVSRLESRIERAMPDQRTALYSYQLGRLVGIAEVQGGASAPKQAAPAKTEPSGQDQTPKSEPKEEPAKPKAKGRQRALEGIREQPRIKAEQEKRRNRLA